MPLYSQAQYRLTDKACIERLNKLIPAKNWSYGWSLKRAAIVNKAMRAYLGLNCDFTSVEAAAFLGVHVNSIRNYLKRGLFRRHYYLSSRKLLLPFAEVIALKETRRAIIHQEAGAIPLTRKNMTLRNRLVRLPDGTRDILPPPADNDQSAP